MSKIRYLLAVLIGLGIMLAVNSKQFIDPFKNVDADTVQGLWK